MVKKEIFFTVLVFFIISAASADTIYLKNGKVIKGKIKSRDAYSIVVDTGKSFPEKFFIQEVARIEEGKQEGDELRPEMEVDSNQAKDLLGWKIDLITSLLEVNGMKDLLAKQAKQIIATAPSDRKEEFKRLFDVNKILRVVIPIYGKYFSEDELKQMLEFYQSPAGRKLTRLSPILTHDIVNAVVSYFKENMSK